ncbi:NEW3 domain-containing protein [Yinghuangia seranimata]|uniref:NEW3 domain-containing protein n=1 Tax=Yinghuangia seranimata TaxID=408067 RepID=UPI00248CA2B0|nr:NEW3 domain-containing protein [Yinghuangia seranimata]MDI2129501.1 NEW3 domain-containing protein [Yinghuangia seranimata]
MTIRRGAVACLQAMVLATAAVGVAGPTASAARATYTIRAGSLMVALDGSGTVTDLVDLANGRDYASGAHRSPLIKLVADGAQQTPTSLSYDVPSSTYTFEFGGKGIKVAVRAVSLPGYATLEVTSVNAPAGVDVQTLLWGPITTGITQTVGETVGVVHDNDFAIGIHGLNDKTVGGWPDEFDKLSYPDGPVKVGTPSSWPFGWFSAHQTTWGSILQAYTYDYTKTRQRYVGWGDVNEPNVAVPPLSGDDAVIKGSKIALFGTAPGDVLGTLSRIETGEGLVHTSIDGQWGKTSQGASQSFLVLGDLNTKNASQASTYAKDAGIRYIYSLPNAVGPWQSTGHYQFDSSFGGSDAGAAGLVHTAAAGGESVGVHTLSNTIDTDDPYVTPVPDPGLATMGSVKLTRPLDASAKTVYVDGDSVFTGGYGKAVRIGDELMTFGAATKVAGSSNEYQVTLENRGGWGTAAAAHPAGADLARMQWYAYGQFDAGMPMIPKIAERFAQIFNATGIKAMSFDGLETATLTGYGTFATNKLVNGMYRRITDTDDFISEASNVLPGIWDAVGRASWGETCCTPLQERYDHQAYYQRNYLPNMMGWVSYSPTDSVLSQEWQLSKMAAFNAGAGLQASVSAFNNSGNTAGVLDAWKQWEAARNAHAFTDAQMKAMQDPNSYWHLENTDPGKAWNLYEVQYPANALSAPSDGTPSSWQYTNTHKSQPLQFQLQASGGSVVNPSITLGGQTVTFNTTVPPGGYLVADGTATAKVYDGTWHELASVTAQGSAHYTEGTQTISYRAAGSAGSTAKIRFLSVGAPQKVTAPIVIAAPATAARGGTTTVTTTYTNTGSGPVKDAEIGLAAPDGWTVKAVGRASFPHIPPGKTVTATWQVTAPANAAVGDGWLVAHIMSAGARTSSEATARITVPDPLSVHGPQIVEAGSSATVTTTYVNGTLQALSNLTVTLAPPAGWSAKATTPANFPSLGAGQTATTTWQLTAPANAAPGTATYTASADYQNTPVKDQVSGEFKVPYPSLSSAFDNAGISDDGNPAAANLDGGGRSLSAQTLAAAGLTPGATVSHDGFSFTWPNTAPGSKDNVVANGQMIKLGGSGGKLGILATNTGGPGSGTGVVTYTDGSTQNFTLAVSDWWDNSAAAGADILATLPHRNASQGGVTDHPVSIYASTVPLQAGKTVAYLTLPASGGQTHIFATAVG